MCIRDSFSVGVQIFFELVMAGHFIDLALFFRAGLRRSREMTLLCSPKMTQHHLLDGAAFGVRQDKDHVPVQTSVRARFGHVIESHFSPFDVICDRSRSCTRRWRRVLAQMMETQTLKTRTPAAWMISPATFVASANPVLRVGHVKRAEVGHFW